MCFGVGALSGKINLLTPGLERNDRRKRQMYHDVCNSTAIPRFLDGVQLLQIARCVDNIGFLK